MAGGLLGQTDGLEAESVVRGGSVRGGQVPQQDCQDRPGDHHQGRGQQGGERVHRGELRGEQGGVPVSHEGEQGDVAESPVPARLRPEEMEDGGAEQDGDSLS